MTEKNELKKKFNIVITDIKKYFKTIKKICNKCNNIKNIDLYRLQFLFYSKNNLNLCLYIYFF